MALNPSKNHDLVAVPNKLTITNEQELWNYFSNHPNTMQRQFGILSNTLHLHHRAQWYFYSGLARLLVHSRSPTLQEFIDDVKRTNPEFGLEVSDLLSPNAAYYSLRSSLDFRSFKVQLGFLMNRYAEEWGRVTFGPILSVEEILSWKSENEMWDDIINGRRALDPITPPAKLKIKVIRS